MSLGGWCATATSTAASQLRARVPNLCPSSLTWRRSAGLGRDAAAMEELAARVPGAREAASGALAVAPARLGLSRLAGRFIALFAALLPDKALRKLSSNWIFSAGGEVLGRRGGPDVAADEGVTPASSLLGLLFAGGSLSLLFLGVANRKTSQGPGLEHSCAGMEKKAAGANEKQSTATALEQKEKPRTRKKLVLTSLTAARLLED